MHGPTTDPIDEAPGTDDATDEDFTRCGSCHDAIPALGPRVCAACYEGGHCPICACKHGARMCPEVAAVWREQENVERAMHRQMIAEAALAVKARYEAMPVWMEAA